jgi:hypothetical protein
MEKQTRMNKYRNLRNQLKKESTYIDESQMLQNAYAKGIIKCNVDYSKSNSNEHTAADADQIEKMINEIKSVIINNPNKTPEEIDRSLKMFEERVALAKKNTNNVESIVQQINAWQKTNDIKPKTKSRANTITNSTRSTTMLNAVNVDLTVDDLIKARQEVVEKLKNSPNSSKSSLKLDETIVAKVSPSATVDYKSKKRNKVYRFFMGFTVSVLVLILLIGLFLVVSFFLFPEFSQSIFSKIRELFS